MNNTLTREEHTTLEITLLIAIGGERDAVQHYEKFAGNYDGTALKNHTEKLAHLESALPKLRRMRIEAGLG